VLYVLIPIVIIGTPLFVTMRRPHRIVRVSLAGSVALLVSAMPDVGSNSAIAIAILTIGFAALASSIALLMVLRKYR
jgi:O-antigen/teichoic acid export membrane protein